jgi:hypothetical protein
MKGVTMAIQQRSRGTAWLQLALVWGFVGLPLAWGVTETVLNALKLFH